MLKPSSIALVELRVAGKDETRMHYQMEHKCKVTMVFVQETLLKHT